jgi:hypothetical protein
MFVRFISNLKHARTAPGSSDWRGSPTFSPHGQLVNEPIIDAIHKRSETAACIPEWSWK